MAINLAGFLYSDNGTAIQSASITLIDSGGNTEATTTTNSSGYWSFAEADEDVYDIKIQSGSQIRYVKGLDKITLSEIDVRNSAANSTGAFTFTNSTNNASNKVGTFRSLNTTRADGDEIYLSFNLMNDNAEETEFARITAEANDVSNGSEDGEIRFSVMKAGTLTEVWNLNSSTAGATSMDMNVDSFTIGAGGDTDITLTFDANSNDGVITWMEDEDYFAFSDEILMNSTEKLLFGDTGTFIHQSSDGVLTITSDTTVDINGAVVFDGALSGITTLGASGVITAGGLTIGSAVIVESELETIDGITAGTAAANKAVVLDGSKNIATIGTIGSAAITSTGTSSFGSGTTIGNLTLANGSITDSGGALDFGNETLTTTGAVDFGAATVDSLTSTGTITGGSDGSGVDVVLYSGTAGDNLTWDASEEQLIITGTNGATSLNVADGNVTIADDLAVDGTSNLDNTDIDGTLVVDGSNISLDSTSTLNIDNSNTSNGITIGTATSGVPISIGHSTSETTVNDNLTVTGDLTVSGTTTTVNSTTVTVDDPIFTLGGDSDPGSDDNKDRGIEFRYHDGSSALRGFFGFDDSSGKFTALTSATNSSEVFSGTAMPAIFGNIEGAAISGTTGTFSGVMDITDTTDASDATGDTGALRTEGGASIAKKLYVGTDLYTDNLDVDGTAELDNITIGGAQGSDGQVLTSTGSGVGWENVSDTTYSAGTLLDLSGTTFNVDLTEAGEAAIANGDYLLFLDGGATGTHAKEAVADLATLFAGTGLTASNSVIGVDTSQAITALTGGDLTIYEDANNADVSLKLGTSATESLTIEVLNGSSNKTAEEVHFSTATASGTADHGKMVFDVDGTDIVTIDDGGLNVGTGSLETATIDYTDGDLAMTIADGGGVTFAQNIQTADIELGHASDTTIARSASGTVTIEGSVITTAGVQNMWIPATAMTPRDNAGCASITTVAAGTNGRPDFHVLDFDKDSDEHAQFMVAMPKSWDGGNINYYVYWIGIAATTGVAWGLQALSLNDNEEFDQAYGTAVIVQDDSQGDATELLVSAKSGDVACGGADGDLVCFQFYRDVSDGNDDMSGDARLVGILIEYTTTAATDG